MRLNAIRATAMALALLPVLASAAPRAWVSATTGVDTGICTRTVPCRTFTYAITQVDAGGEVNALDSGGYGVMMISKSVIVNIAPGICAGIVAATGAAITISASATDKVVLRGLTISSSAGHGIFVLSAGTVHVEHSELSGGNAYAGIVVANPTPATLVVSDVVFRNYANGISTAGAGQLDLVVERTQALGTSYAGVLLSGTNVRAIMKESVLSGSLYGAVVDCPTPSASVAMTAESNLISHNQYGVLMNAADTCTSQLTLSNNVIANNDSGIYFAASIATPVVYTRTNNTFTGNMSDVSGAPAHPLTPLTPK